MIVIYLITADVFVVLKKIGSLGAREMAHRVKAYAGNPRT